MRKNTEIIETNNNLNVTHPAINFIVKKLFPKDEWGSNKVRNVAIGSIGFLMIGYIVLSNIIQNQPDEKLEYEEQL